MYDLSFSGLALDAGIAAKLNLSVVMVEPILHCRSDTAVSGLKFKAQLGFKTA